MKTSRVNPTTSSIFRNSRQYLQSNERVFKVMPDGSGQQSLANQRQKHQKRDKENQNNKQTKTKVLKNTTGKMAVKGLQFDACSVMIMQNSLIKHSVKISTERNKQARIRTYRTSI